jgi:hypothetical protein
MPITSGYNFVTPPTTVMRKVKRPAPVGFGRHPAYDLGTDVYGTWLFSSKGTVFRGQDESGVTECEVGQGTADAGRPVLHLIPNGAWWVAWWCELFISVDICVPASLADGEWSFTDLELDVLAFPDGRVEVHDEDEYIEARDAGTISEEESRKAQAALVDVERWLRDGVEPFGGIGWARLDQATSLGLPAIKVLSHVPTA